MSEYPFMAMKLTKKIYNHTIFIGTRLCRNYVTE